jgi:hypothetical protein
MPAEVEAVAAEFDCLGEAADDAVGLEDDARTPPSSEDVGSGEAGGPRTEYGGADALVVGRGLRDLVSARALEDDLLATRSVLFPGGAYDGLALEHDRRAVHDERLLHRFDRPNHVDADLR